MKKSFIMLPCIAAVAIATYVVKKTFESHANETSSLLMQNIEALSQGGDNLPSWANKRLKLVSCECPNGKKGKTLKCRTDGDLEKCTATQQGSSACYKVSLGGIKISCE